MAEFKDLKGNILINIDRIGNEKLIFTCENGSKYIMYHKQQCCESVEIEDINGDLNDLLNNKILVAEERTNCRETDFCRETYYCSETWTFYTIRTQKASIDIRWYGQSNGYYSESVDFDKENN